MCKYLPWFFTFAKLFEKSSSMESVKCLKYMPWSFTFSKIRPCLKKCSWDRSVTWCYPPAHWQVMENRFKIKKALLKLLFKNHSRRYKGFFCWENTQIKRLDLLLNVASGNGVISPNHKSVLYLMKQKTPQCLT